MGDQFAAHKWFSMAHSVNPTQTNVAREAGIAALDAGMIEDAVRLCHAAVNLSPDDSGLQSNLALAYLLAGNDTCAEECARVAVQQDPHDSISKTVLKLVRDVVSGGQRGPAKLGDAFPVRWTASLQPDGFERPSALKDEKNYDHTLCSDRD